MLASLAPAAELLAVGVHRRGKVSARAAARPWVTAALSLDPGTADNMAHDFPFHSDSATVDGRRASRRVDL